MRHSNMARVTIRAPHASVPFILSERFKFSFSSHVQEFQLPLQYRLHKLSWRSSSVENFLVWYVSTVRYLSSPYKNQRSGFGLIIYSMVRDTEIREMLIVWFFVLLPCRNRSLCSVSKTQRRWVCIAVRRPCFISARWSLSRDRERSRLRPTALQVLLTVYVCSQSISRPVNQSVSYYTFICYEFIYSGKLAASHA